MHREYGLDAHAVRQLTTRQFGVRIGGLSGDALFREAWKRTPRQVVDPGEIAAITGIPAT